MSKKFLRKNEIRADLNPAHFNKYGSLHDAIITAKKGHKYKANTKTHSEYVNKIRCLDLEPHLPNNVRHQRISPQFWQSEKQFGDKMALENRELKQSQKQLAINELVKLRRQFFDLFLYPTFDVLSSIIDKQIEELKGE